jgi:antitoxin (DNA-binding transcriptional repressor) of toxin-antitoxin stability system
MRLALSAGHLLAIVETQAGWQAVVCSDTIAENGPVVADVVPVDTLGRRQQIRAQRWLTEHRSQPSIPDDLQKSRDRYLAQARAKDSRARKDARQVLALIERGARAEQAGANPVANPHGNP